MADQLNIGKCKRLGCGKPLPVPKRKGGRAQEYCCDACKIAAWRERKAPVCQAPGPVESHRAAAADEIGFVAAANHAPSDEQAAQAIMQWRNLISSTRRLAREARPEFAWRFGEASAGLTELLARLFGDADG